MRQSCSILVVRVSVLCFSSTFVSRRSTPIVFPCWAPWRVGNTVDDFFSLNYGAKQEEEMQISHHCLCRKLSCQTLNKIITIYPKSFRALSS